MSTLFLVVGDLHIKVGDTTIDILTDKIIDNINKYRPQYLVLLGDILHNHDKASIMPMKKATTLINRAKKLCHVIIIIGNHDRINNNDFCSDLSFFDAYSETDNVTVVDTPKKINIGKKNIVFCPYVAKGRFKEALRMLVSFSGKSKDKISINDVSIVFAHQEIIGCKLSSAFNSTDGDKWNIDYPFVISGQIHKHHYSQKNVFYTGTPRQNDFGEQNDTYKRIWLIDVDKASGTMSENIIDIDLDMPMYRTFTLTIEDIKSCNIENPDQYCRIYIDFSSTSSTSEIYTNSRIIKLRKKGCKIIPRKTIEEKITKSKTENTDKTINRFIEDCIEISIMDVLKNIKNEDQKKYSTDILTKVMTKDK